MRFTILLPLSLADARGAMSWNESMEDKAEEPSVTASKIPDLSQPLIIALEPSSFDMSL